MSPLRGEAKEQTLKAVRNTITRNEGDKKESNNVSKIKLEQEEKVMNIISGYRYCQRRRGIRKKFKLEKILIGKQKQHKWK